jgi:4-hydroxy-tetrahydrodipicolinate reductase
MTMRGDDTYLSMTLPTREGVYILLQHPTLVFVGAGRVDEQNRSLSPTLPRREGDKNRVVLKNEKGKVMLVWSSNYSVGVNIFFEVNKLLAAKMASQPQYTPSITETHHIHKLDKPSGTAKTLAEQIEHELPSLQGGAGGRLPIESIREGEVPGTHEVKWDSEEDTIIITHIAKGRRGFALGAVLAAEKLV